MRLALRLLASGLLALAPACRAGQHGVAASDTRSLHLRVLATHDLHGALRASVALGFFQVLIGKAAHDAEMRAFFAFSGLPIWFHYVVMGVELIAAIGLLVPRWSRVAALPLIAVMLGAIGTHAHNGDPLSDSLEAIHNLIVLACLLVITRATRSRA